MKGFGRLRKSVRVQLTLWYALALALPLIAFAAVSYLFFSRTVHLRTEAFVTDALIVFERELGAERRAGAVSDDVILRTLQDLRFREVDIVVLDEVGGVVGTSPHVAGEGSGEGTLPPSGLRRLVTSARPVELLAGEPHVTTLHQDGRTYRALRRPVQVAGRPYQLVGIHPMADVEALLGRIRGLFLVAIPLIVACSGGGGLFLVRRSFQPVTAMAARAAEIGGTNLGERLPVATGDELGELARVLNDLLDRLERAFQQQRRFMADASHELRTPTAIVRTEAEVTLSRQGRTEKEYRASLQIILDTARHLGRVVEDQFLAARADAGQLGVGRHPLFLDDLVRESARMVHPIADERGVRIEVAALERARVVGDADLLHRLILNLLDNAIKHSPRGARIDVSLTVQGHACEIEVVDHGSGIPPEATEYLFDRFFQFDPARARNERGTSLTGGAGLGLAIARSITDLHGGSVELASSRPGRTVFRVTLPLA